MANPFSKGWKYLMSSFDQKIDENADPKVQIQQATEEAKRRHAEISKQAASVIGNEQQLAMNLDRLRKDQADLQDKARQAVQMADKASAAGDAEKTRQLNETAEVFATQLVAVEQQVEETATLQTQAAQAAEQARRQQAESEARLKEQLSQIDQLRAQVDQTRMQEASTQALDSMNTVGGDDSVPTLDDVRDKIERRYADALGAQELTRNSVTDRMSEIAQAGNDMRAADRLAQIRAELGSEERGELTAGADAPVDAETEDAAGSADSATDATDAAADAEDAAKDAATDAGEDAAR
ncbi:PspA/IM30 family protein [Corynebacterium frankenforstense]|uniref:PspA/IM30 family protein n=1 Tax=Corynebacterium frankenforstense TaxID=1230998 RepID=UPI0026EC144D|nr:PspA/IM30 family protein [Corynebacterium frankenforstense]